jgi:hypothetical protein
MEFDPFTDSNIMVNVGGNIILIRGHNLVPLPFPSSSGFSFYPASNRDSDAGPSPPATLPDDKGLLYQYRDHELAFSWPRSL